MDSSKEIAQGGNPEQKGQEIMKLLGLSAFPAGAAPLDSSQPPPSQEQERRRDVVGRRKSRKEKEASRPAMSEVEHRVVQESRLELTRQKRGEEFTPSEETRKFLEGKHLFPLREKSAKFPRARWFCRLTEYHCDNIAKCLEHISEPRYQRLFRARELDMTLSNLPRPSNHHIQSLNILLGKIQEEHGLSDRDIQERNTVASKVHNLLEVSRSHLELQYFGFSTL